MIPVQIAFLVTTGLTLLSGLGALALVMFGDTRPNSGQRMVAEKFAAIATVGAAAIAAMLALPK